MLILFSTGDGDNSTIGGITNTTNNNSLFTSNCGEWQNFVGTVLHKYPDLSSLKRDRVVNKPHVPGLIWLRAEDRLATLYNTRNVVQGNDQMLLGSQSNDSTSIRPRLVSTSIFDNVLVLVNKEDVPSNVTMGKVIDKTNEHLKGFVCNNEGAPLDSNDKVVVRLPVSMPLWKSAQIPSGPINQGTYDSLEEMDSVYAPFWLDSMKAWDADFQTLLLSDESLKGFLPPRPPVGYEYTSSAHIPFTDIDDDDVDLNEEVETLSKESNEIAKQSLFQQQDDLSLSGNGSGNATRPQLARRKSSLGPGAMDIDSQEVNTPRAMTEADQFDARIGAFGAVYDPKTKTVVLSEHSIFVPSMRDATSKTAAQQAAVSSMLSIEDSIADTSHYLARLCDMPKIEKITAAYIAQGQFSDEAIKSLDMTTSRGVVVPALMPDSATTAAAKSEQEHLNIAEEAMGEHDTKRTKLQTSFTTVSELVGINSLLGLLGNLLVLFLLYYNFDLGGGGGGGVVSSLPSVAEYTLSFADIITSKRARRWMKSFPALRPQLLHYVLNQVISVCSGFARASQDVLVTTSIAREAISSIPTRHYETAHRIYESTMDTLERIFLNSTTVPSSAIWEASSAKKRIEEKEERALLAKWDAQHEKKRKASNTPTGQERDPKKGRHGGGGGGGGNDTGLIACTSTNLSLPTECFNSSYKICKADLRDKSKCPNPNCKNAHISDLAQLERPRAVALVKHVDKSDSMSFVNCDEKLLADLRSEK